MKKSELKLLISSDEVAGKIIRDAAELEWYVELVLTRYFTAQDRFNEFMDVIIDRMSFFQKIDILRRMKLPTKMKSQPNAVASLEKLRKIRNILAHSAFISDEEIDKLYSDNEVMKILGNYPKSYRSELLATKNRLNRLLHSHIIRSKKKEENNKANKINGKNA